VRGGEDDHDVEVRIPDEDWVWLRRIGRPRATGDAAQRTIGVAPVASGVLQAAVELLQDVSFDLWGIDGENIEAIAARAKAALSGERPDRTES
jgi:hypothetical protein